MIKNLAIALLMILGISQNSIAQNDLHKLKIVIIRHGEKPLKGDNLTCKGLNRALMLPKVITTKFGIPDLVYVPQMEQGESTLHSRMFQTVMPLVAKYNLKINTTFPQNNYKQIAEGLESQTVTILMAWEHKAIAPIVKALGVDIAGLNWPDDDFDSIWIITFPKGIPTLTRDKEGLMPLDKCNF
jgi:hypothetical protein